MGPNKRCAFRTNTDNARVYWEIIMSENSEAFREQRRAALTLGVAAVLAEAAGCATHACVRQRNRGRKAKV